MERSTPPELGARRPFALSASGGRHTSTDLRGSQETTRGRPIPFPRQGVRKGSPLWLVETTEHRTQGSNQPVGINVSVQHMTEGVSGMWDFLSEN